MAVKEFEYEYDPIKVAKDGSEAERVVWSTKALNAAVEGLNKGLPLKANPFCGKDTGLLKPDLVYKRTEEEIEDYIHCMQDPIYFASKCFLMTPEGLKPCVLRDYQEDYLHHLQNNRFSIFLSCRQSGKCLSMLTNINIKITENSNLDSQQVRKICYYYINDNIYCIPFFEVYNIYCKQTLMWKLKYHLYKFIYKLTYGREKGD
jgi:hypothetical protein